MGNIFEQPEPDILRQYYDKGESFWQTVKRNIQNVLRRLRGAEPLDEPNEYDDGYEEWAWWSDKD